MTLADWLSDLLEEARDGLVSVDLASVAEGLLEKAEVQMEFYSQPGPDGSESVRAPLAEMADLLFGVGEDLLSFVESGELELLEEARRKAVEMNDIRQCLQYDLELASQCDSQLSSY